jgi:hypothetical protein
MFCTRAVKTPVMLVQVQTLYYLGPAGTARKRTAAAAAQGDAAPDAEAAAAPATEEGGSKKGGKRGKRRKHGAATAEAAEDEGAAAAAAEKENELPGTAAADAKKAAAASTLEQPEVQLTMLQSYGKQLHMGCLKHCCLDHLFFGCSCAQCLSNSSARRSQLLLSPCTMEAAASAVVSAAAG